MYTGQTRIGSQPSLRQDMPAAPASFFAKWEERR